MASQQILSLVAGRWSRSFVGGERLQWDRPVCRSSVRPFVTESIAQSLLLAAATDGDNFYSFVTPEVEAGPPAASW